MQRSSKSWERFGDAAVLRTCGLAVALCCLLVPWDVDAHVIAVAGWNSEQTSCNPRGIPARCSGLFETARILGGTSVIPHKIPGVFPPELFGAGVYASIEQAVLTEATEFLLKGEEVQLLGFSHGATLVLRVAQQLAKPAVPPAVSPPLEKLSIVTIDLIEDHYPFPASFSVPLPVTRALNLYQTLDPLLTGARVRNATNVDVSLAIFAEQSLGKQRDPLDERFVPPPLSPQLLAPQHTFIDDSFAVRRRILRLFHRDADYLPGFWQWAATGQVVSGGPVNSSGLFLLDYTDEVSQGFLAREWLISAGRFIAFTGTVASGSVNGSWLIPFIGFANQDASGKFGGTTDFQTRIDLSLTGQWPVFSTGPTFASHLEPFTGTVMVERVELESPEEFIPDVSPELILTVNGTSFHAGDTLVVGQRLRNPGDQTVVDVYLGVVLPDGTVLFMTSLTPFTATAGRADDASSFHALQTGALVPKDSDITTPGFLSVTFSGNEPAGTYVIFAALTKPGAFTDGRIDPGDVLSYSVQSFVVGR